MDKKAINITAIFATKPIDIDAPTASASNAFFSSLQKKQTNIPEKIFPQFFQEKFTFNFKLFCLYISLIEFTNSEIVNISENLLYVLKM